MSAFYQSWCDKADSKDKVNPISSSAVEQIIVTIEIDINPIFGENTAD